MENKPQSDPTFSLKNVHVTRDSKPVLRDVSVQVTARRVREKPPLRVYWQA
jgi:ABC-type molybdenum transport system ATPase subunit/photorepair protein PhrA